MCLAHCQVLQELWKRASAMLLALKEPRPQLESQGSRTDQLPHLMSVSPFHGPGPSQKVSRKWARHPESSVFPPWNLIRNLGLVNFLHPRDYQPSLSQHCTAQPLSKHSTLHSARWPPGRCAFSPWNHQSLRDSRVKSLPFSHQTHPQLQPRPFL